MAPRRRAREVKVGSLVLGGEHPIRVQSMTSTATADAGATIAQIQALADAGCEVIRVTVDTFAAAAALPEIRRRCPIPLVADIHYDHKLALESAPFVDKIRINPGNIGSPENVRRVVARADEFGLPIRVGVNAGSIERDIALKYGARLDGSVLSPPEAGYPAEALVESALRNAETLEAHGFTRTILSVKASNVPLMVRAYRMLAQACDYPLHLGVTEAGTKDSSNIKSGIGIGALLLDGIGDTLRVSIAGRSNEDKVGEVRSGFRILQALGLRRYGVEVVACPTCGRENPGFDTAAIAREIETLASGIATPLKIAVMGCVVNGPGEAADADLGLVATGETARIYRRGQVVETLVPFSEATQRILALIGSL